MKKLFAGMIMTLTLMVGISYAGSGLPTPENPWPSVDGISPSMMRSTLELFVSSDAHHPGDPLFIHAQLLDQDGLPIQGKTIVFLVHYDGSSHYLESNEVTNSSGVAQVGIRPIGLTKAGKPALKILVNGHTQTRPIARDNLKIMLEQ